MKDNRKDFGKQMDQSKQKDCIVDFCVATERMRVLDLGAGTCKIAHQLVDKGINVVAVDNHLNDYDIVKSDKAEIRYVNANIDDFINAAKIYDDIFDCVILSGVLHELNDNELTNLTKSLGSILSQDAIVIIREPVYNTRDFHMEPFKSLAAQDMAIGTMLANGYSWFYDLYDNTKKIRKPTEAIQALNLLNANFTFSYGLENWERELHECRFSFSQSEITSCIKQIFKLEDVFVYQFNYFDKSYYDYFKKAGLSTEILDSINYTNSIFVASKKSLKHNILNSLVNDNE